MTARNPSDRSKRRSRGAALIMALLLVTIVGVGAAAVWQYLHITLKESTHAESREVVFCLAEAGLDKAIAMLRTKPDYSGEKNTPLGEGQFSVRVTPAKVPGQYQVKSEAFLGEENRTQARCALTASLRLSPTGDLLHYEYRMESPSLSESGAR
jgi:type II secretory pathway component PulK